MAGVMFREVVLEALERNEAVDILAFIAGLPRTAGVTMEDTSTFARA